jgi:hypothetical protein
MPLVAGKETDTMEIECRDAAKGAPASGARGDWQRMALFSSWSSGKVTFQPRGSEKTGLADVGE